VRLKYRRVDCTAWRGTVLVADGSWRRVVRAISSRLTCYYSACGAVGVASGLHHDNRRILVRFATRGKRFMSSVNAQTVSRIPQPPIIGFRASFSGGTCRLALETYLSLLFSAEVNSEWRYTSTPTIRLYGMHRFFAATFQEKGTLYSFNFWEYNLDDI
jgi:hypothetical protein